MILSGKAIQELIDRKQLVAEPAVEVKEASIKVHLSSQFGKERNAYEKKEEYLLQPKEFILALSKESFTFPENYAGLYDGHISLSSKGILTHLGSMLIEPGFSGQILLEIFNASDKPIKLEQGMRMGNLMILEVKGLL